MASRGSVEGEQHERVFVGSIGHRHHARRDPRAVQWRASSTRGGGDVRFRQCPGAAYAWRTMATPPATDRGALRSALARFTARPEWLPEVSEAITDAIHAELPELNTDADLRTSTYASTESVLRMLAEMIAAGRAP